MKRTRIALAVAVMASLVGTLGCAFGEIRWDDPLQREISLEDAQERYSVLVRWNDFEKASMFVEPSLRDAYLETFPSFRDVRITEYESDRVEIDADKAKATLEVRYYLYTLSSPVEMTITETQEWYRVPGLNNDWYVKSTFRGLDEILAAK